MYIRLKSLHYIHMKNKYVSVGSKWGTLWGGEVCDVILGSTWGTLWGGEVCDVILGSKWGTLWGGEVCDFILGSKWGTLWGGEDCDFILGSKWGTLWGGFYTTYSVFYGDHVFWIGFFGFSHPLFDLFVRAENFSALYVKCAWRMYLRNFYVRIYVTFAISDPTKSA